MKYLVIVGITKYHEKDWYFCETDTENINDFIARHIFYFQHELANIEDFKEDIGKDLPGQAFYVEADKLNKIDFVKVRNIHEKYYREKKEKEIRENELKELKRLKEKYEK